jgi:transaldolase / glucose-6-phosphate isomerase
VERYEEVAEAYLSGLEDLHHRGGDLHPVASVASFFVSRVDTKVDKLLTSMIGASRSPGAGASWRSYMAKLG